MGQLDTNTRCMSDIKSVDVGTLVTVEDIKNLVHEGGLGVGPTETLYMQWKCLTLEQVCESPIHLY